MLLALFVFLVYVFFLCIFTFGAARNKVVCCHTKGWGVRKSESDHFRPGAFAGGFHCGRVGMERTYFFLTVLPVG